MYALCNNNPLGIIEENSMEHVAHEPGKIITSWIREQCRQSYVKGCLDMEKVRRNQNRTRNMKCQRQKLSERWFCWPESEKSKRLPEI